MPEPPEDQLTAEAVSQALGSFPPLLQLPFGLPFCCVLERAWHLGSLADLCSVRGVLLWLDLFLQEGLLRKHEGRLLKP